jgi:pyrimidine-nucleoside phosphorylase
MRAVDIIRKKRDCQELSAAEIDFFIRGYTRGEIPDYQAAAWAMAVLLNGMTDRETTDLTLAMAHSGEVLDLSLVVPVAVDKHSTGGVGDKTSLLVVPVVAACGLPVGKMSGRGLGFTGGTLDKLESIPGYRADLSTQEFLEHLSSVGLVLTGQTVDLAPADGKLYALRDVTATVQSIPLIASSIMSKKIAAGAQAIVLDVKVGEGAFMHTLAEARQLAKKMVAIAALAQRKAVALLSNMDQPLGWAVGNALEVREAVETLRGNGPPDFQDHCLQVSAYMLALAGIAPDVSVGKAMAGEALRSGCAYEKFKDLVAAQGGDVRYIEELDRLPQAAYIETVPAPRAGFLAAVHAREVSETTILLGAGRARKGDAIDHAVGVVIHHKVGTELEAGQPLFTVHANDPERLQLAKENLLAAHAWSDQPVEPLKQFFGVIDATDIKE